MTLTGVTLSAPFLDPESLRAIDTPALVIDRGRMDAAIDAMAAGMAERGVSLRPHAKTHKSLEVARRQVQAGAAGLTIATIGEGEVFADGGFDDLFIAYPLVPGPAKGRRLRALAERTRLTIGIDSPIGAQAVADALGPVRDAVRVLVEIDAGGLRSGAPPDEAGTVGVAARRLGLPVMGVFTHGGHSYASAAMRGAAADDEVRSLTEAAASLAGVGIESPVVSAGSTPTALASARGAVNEERPGTYVFGDRQQAALGSIGPDGIAAAIVATVVSVNRGARRFVVDAGGKMLGKDVAPYLDGHGEIPALGGLTIARLADHHGTVDAPAGAALPAVGQVVAVLPNHICPVVNLVDAFLVVRDGRLVDTWTVDARGRNS
jgi:D-serine deaminase-like pyridoxal phosphate-dependent protein